MYKYYQTTEEYQNNLQGLLEALKPEIQDCVADKVLGIFSCTR